MVFSKCQIMKFCDIHLFSFHRCFFLSFTDKTIVNCCVISSNILLCHLKFSGSRPQRYEVFYSLTLDLLQEQDFT